MRLAPLLLRVAAAALIVLWGVPTAEPMWADPEAAVGPGERLLAYAGVTVRVPAGWPVYDLAARPRTCVRYDVNAVYLGHPGPDQDCPARAMGHVDTLSIEPEAVPRSRVPDAGVANAANAAGDPGTEMTLSRRVGAVRLTASYADDDTQAAAILGSARLSGGARAASPASAAYSRDAGSIDEAADETAPTSPGYPANIAEPAAMALTQPRPRTGSLALKAAATFTGSGFDTCAAPSLGTMTTWATASPFRAAGVYIGGSDRACPDGNLSPSWVRQVGALGWHLFPIYVGRQASCWQDPAGPKSKAPRIDHAHRWTQGVQAADDAAARAAYFGLSPASILYFDMEYYPRAVTQCSQDVQAFLNAWTDELHKRGFLSGIYSSARGAVADMAAVYSTMAGYRADAVWFAHWDAKAATSGDPSLDDKLWPGHRRIKQFAGAHDATFGGKKLNIDSDVLDAPVAALASAKPPPSGPPPRAPRPGLKRPVLKDQQSSATS